MTQAKLMHEPKARTRIAIIGASISGSATALALSRHKNLEIEVFERRKRSEVADKPCGNICTNEINKYIRKLGLKGDFKLSEYREIEVFSPSKTAAFPTKEYEIDRKKLLDGMIGVAEMNGVKFNFSHEFVSMEEGMCDTALQFKFGKNNVYDNVDIVIGADGSNSKVAEIIGKENEDFYMFLQTTVPAKDVRYKCMQRSFRQSLRPDKNGYKIFIGEEYGYYAYIFPSKDGKYFKIGLGDDYTHDVMKKFKSFLINFGLGGIGDCDISGALIPKPGLEPTMFPPYLIGDASCNVKYTGGGIVPDMEQALALADKIVNKNYFKSFSLKKKSFINSRISWMIENMFDKDCDRAVEIFRSPEFKQIFLKRDNPKIIDMIKLISPRTIWFVAGILGNIMIGRRKK